jgi:hypothetical protein
VTAHVVKITNGRVPRRRRRGRQPHGQIGLLGADAGAAGASAILSVTLLQPSDRRGTLSPLHGDLGRHAAPCDPLQRPPDRRRPDPDTIVRLAQIPGSPPSPRRPRTSESSPG